MCVYNVVFFIMNSHYVDEDKWFVFVLFKYIINLSLKLFLQFVYYSQYNREATTTSQNDGPEIANHQFVVK